MPWLRGQDNLLGRDGLNWTVTPSSHLPFMHLCIHMSNKLQKKFSIWFPISVILHWAHINFSRHLHYTYNLYVTAKNVFD